MIIESVSNFFVDLRIEVMTLENTHEASSVISRSFCGDETHAGEGNMHWWFGKECEKFDKKRSDLFDWYTKWCFYFGIRTGMVLGLRD